MFFENIKNNPYHWDDREKAARDYRYIQTLKNTLIIELQKKLNDLHGTDFTPRAWNIMIGYWLNQFITVIFDRISVLKSNLQLMELLNLKKKKHKQILILVFLKIILNQKTYFTMKNGMRSL